MKLEILQLLWRVDWREISRHSRRSESIQRRDLVDIAGIGLPRTQASRGDEFLLTIRVEGERKSENRKPRSTFEMRSPNLVSVESLLLQLVRESRISMLRITGGRGAKGCLASGEISLKYEIDILQPQTSQLSSRALEKLTDGRRERGEEVRPKKDANSS